MTSSNSRTSQLLAHLDAHRASLLDTLQSIPSELHHRKPAPDRWSVAEVVEHLTLVEPRMLQLLSMRIPQAPPLRGERVPTPEELSARLDHAAILDRRRAITAGEAVQPKGALALAEGIAALMKTREQLRAVVAETDGLDLAAITHPHPALGPLDLVQWVLFVGSHEARHTAQIREIVASLAAQ